MVSFEPQCELLGESRQGQSSYPCLEEEPNFRFLSTVSLLVSGQDQAVQELRVHPVFPVGLKSPLPLLKARPQGSGIVAPHSCCAEATQRSSFSALSFAEVNVSSSSWGAFCSWHLSRPLLCSHWLINFRWHLHQQPGNTVLAWSSLFLAYPHQGQDI